MSDYRKLKVWQVAHELTLAVYGATKSFPREEVYGLTAQLRRSVSSIPANIAEGVGRDGQKELARFLRIAKGSANETEYHLLLASDLGYLSQTEHTSLTNQASTVRKMIDAFIRTLMSDDSRTGNQKLATGNPKNNTGNRKPETGNQEKNKARRIR